jgi:hypothetical protein
MADQGELFEEQQENLERVRTRIRHAIIEFCRGHEWFHADELRAYVASETGVSAPASADRVLRDLRQKGHIDYVVANRRGSLYLVTKVTEGAR